MAHETRTEANLGYRSTCCHGGPSDVSLISLGWVIDRSFIWRRRQDTGSNLSSNVSLIETLARAFLKAYLPDSLGIERKRVGLRTAVHDQRPKDSAVQRGESIVRGLDCPGLGIVDRSVTPIAQ